MVVGAAQADRHGRASSCIISNNTIYNEDDVEQRDVVRKQRHDPMFIQPYSPRSLCVLGAAADEALLAGRLRIRLPADGAPVVLVATQAE